MSKSGYDEYDDCDEYSQWAQIRWRGQVTSAIRGKRGQAFLRELIEALDALPLKKLAPDDLQSASGEVCALGAVGLKRGIELDKLDPEDHAALSETFGIARQLVQEIEWENDSGGKRIAPEIRWRYMRDWAQRQLIEPKP